MSKQSFNQFIKKLEKRGYECQTFNVPTIDFTSICTNKSCNQKYVQPAAVHTCKKCGSKCDVHLI